MKQVIVALAVAAALVLSGCATAAPTPVAATSAPPQVAVDAPATDAPTMDATPAGDPLTVDVATSKTYTFEDGLTVTFDGATIATAAQIGSDPVKGMQPVILAFTYKNGSVGPIPLQQVPLTVRYGNDLYDAHQPTLYDGDTTHTEIPQRIAAGSTVKVVDTYWIPAGEPISATINVSGSQDQVRPTPTFDGITAG